MHRPSSYFNAEATTEIYTLSLHDALPISGVTVLHDPVTGGPVTGSRGTRATAGCWRCRATSGRGQDRKSTRLNSSHSSISYAVFCLKKKNNVSSIPRLNKLRAMRQTSVLK